MDFTDLGNISFLIFLYTLQGIPLGICGVIPLYLQSAGASYSNQSHFSLVMWPFSLKILWAPFVDAIFLPKIGRRKSWLVPTQYILGFIFIVLSRNITELIARMDVLSLTFAFSLASVMAATQDVAVDGWAISILPSHLLQWASTCNVVGQMLGVFISKEVFMTLESATFCNTYLRTTPSDTGIMTFHGFLLFWGIVFVVSTTLIMLFKTEKEIVEDMSCFKVYTGLFEVCKKPKMGVYILNQLVAKIGFAPIEAIYSLKLISKGVSRYTLVQISAPLTLIQILLPFVLEKFGLNKHPLTNFVKQYKLRLLIRIPQLLVFFWVTVSTDITSTIIFFIFVTSFLTEIVGTSMTVATMVFHTSISDPVIGGSYMTLLNTVSNLGYTWPATFFLKFADHFDINISSKLKIDGIYTMALICSLWGIIWIKYFSEQFVNLEDINGKFWRVKSYD